MMGILNLKWHKACAISNGRIFMQAEKAAGWPESFTTAHLGQLQYPDSNPDCLAIQRALIADCAIGVLLNTKTTNNVLVSPSRVNDTLQKASLFGASARVVYTTPAQYKDVTVYTITAQAFSDWMAEQGETPSVHIQAWFDTLGVAGAAHPEPGMEAAPVVAAGAPKEALFDSAPEKKKSKPRVSWKTEIPYIAEVYVGTTQSGAKGLWRELKAKAGTVGSPFILGQGTDREKLLVKESHASLAEHTLETNMTLVRAEAERLPKKHR